MAKETKHNFHIANGDAQFLDNIAQNQGAGYTNESVQENYGWFKNQEKQENCSKDSSLEREAFDIIKQNAIPNENGDGHYKLDETYERKDGSEKKWKEKKKKKKKRKKNIVGDNFEIESSNHSIVQEPRTDDNPKHPESHTIVKHQYSNEIIFGEVKVPEEFIELDKGATGVQNGTEARVKRKKKKRLLDLKKSSSKVGFQQTDIIPPIHAIADHKLQENKGDEESLRSQVNSTAVRSQAARTDSRCSLVSSCKEDDYKKPLRFCVWITRFPVLSFCKYLVTVYPEFFARIPFSRNYEVS